MPISFVEPPLEGSPGIIIRDPVARWKARLMEVLDREREWRRQCRMLLRQYKYGSDESFSPFTDRVGGRMTVNLTFSFIRTVLASAAFRAPKVVVKGLGPEDHENAPVLEAVLNDANEACDAERLQRRITLDALITGKGYGAVGYASKYGIVSKILDPRRDKKREVEFDEYITDERVFFRRVSPFNIIIDPFAEGIHDARWVAERFVRPLDVLQNDRRVNAKGRNIAPGRVFMGTDDLTDEAPFEGFGARVIDSPIMPNVSGAGTVDVPIEYYLIWDKETRKVFTVQESLDGWFADPRDWGINVGGVPYEDMTPFEVPEDPKGTSLTEQLSWHQYEINEISRFHIDMVKRQNPKIVVRRDSMSLEDMELLRSGVPGAVVQSQDPGRDWKEYTPPRITPDSYSIKETMRREMNIITGVSDPNLGGQTSGGRTTATQNIREERSFQVRIDDVVSSVQSFGAKIGEKMSALVTQLYTTQDYVRIAGPLGIQFQPYIGVQLAGRYRFTVEMNSTTPQSEAIRRKQLLDALQIFANFPDVIDRRQLVMRILRAFPELGADREALVITPQAAKLQALQMALANPELMARMQGGRGGAGGPGKRGGVQGRNPNVGTGVNIRGGDSSDRASTAMRLSA